MTPEMKNLLKFQEGKRLKPYRCSEGILTIGYGYNLEEGISDRVADIMFEETLYSAFNDLKDEKYFQEANQIRQDILMNMVFNLGKPRFNNFKKFIKALENKDYITASREMLDSKWAKQVGERAKHLSAMMAEGRYIEWRY